MGRRGGEAADDGGFIRFFLPVLGNGKAHLALLGCCMSLLFLKSIVLPILPESKPYLAATVLDLVSHLALHLPVARAAVFYQLQTTTLGL